MRIFFSLSSSQNRLEQSPSFHAQSVERSRESVFLVTRSPAKNFHSCAGCGTLDSKGIYKGAFDADGHDANAFAPKTGLAGGNSISFLQ